MKYSGVKAGEVALVEKVLQDFQKIDISEYGEVRLWAKEQEASILDGSGAELIEIDESDPKGDLSGPVFEEDMVEFVFRFGNSDSSYYEYSTFFGEVDDQGKLVEYSKSLRERYWYSKEGLSFNISDFVELKEKYINDHGFLLESIDTSTILENGGKARVFSTTGVLPSVASITWMAFGVKRSDNAVGGIASGEIWLNGLRIFGIRDVKGWAFRAKLDTKWADFLTASASMDYDEADFRQMSEQANDTKDSRVASDINSQLHFDKFMPAKWGVKIPVSAHIGASLSRPRQVNGSDIFLTDDKGEGDRFGDMIDDFADLVFKSDISKDTSEAEHYEKAILVDPGAPVFLKIQHPKLQLEN